MMSQYQLLANHTLKACAQDEQYGFLIRKLGDQQRLNHKDSICPNPDQMDRNNNDKQYNARYPCYAGIVRDRLACASNPENTAPEYYQKARPTRSRDKDITVKKPGVKQVTIITLAVITSATFTNLPTNPPMTTPTSIATAAETTVTAIAESVWKTSIFYSIIAILKAKASSLDTTRLLEPDLVLVIWMSFSVPCLALVFILLLILTWREWETRRVEERVARDCADLGMMPLPQWREPVIAMGSADMENELALNVRLQRKLQKIRETRDCELEEQWERHKRREPGHISQ